MRESTTLSTNVQNVAVRIKDGKGNLLYSTETLSENLTENRSLKLLSSFYIVQYIYGGRY